MKLMHIVHDFLSSDLIEMEWWLLKCNKCAFKAVNHTTLDAFSAQIIVVQKHVSLTSWPCLRGICPQHHTGAIECMRYICSHSQLRINGVSNANIMDCNILYILIIMYRVSICYTCLWDVACANKLDTPGCSALAKHRLHVYVTQCSPEMPARMMR